MRQEATISFTVVVCTRGRPEKLKQCLDALACLSYPRFEVLVVENAPHEGRAKDVAKDHHARYLLEPAVGVSHARNQGISASGADVVAYVDDDAVPDPNWLSALAAEFQDPQVMAVAGRILPSTPKADAETLGPLVFSHDLGPDRQVFDSSTPNWFERANFGGIGNEANVAFRRSHLGTWFSFNERLGRGTAIGGWEGHYAFFLVIDRGYRVVYTPHAIVRHPYPQSLEGLRRRFLANISGACAYMILLLVEEQRYRWKVLWYALQSLGGKRRTWRKSGVNGSAQAHFIPRWRKCLACLSGPLLYLRSR